MNSIRKTLSISLAAAFIALTLAISIFYYRFTKNVILDTMSKNRQDSLSLVSQKVDSILNSAYTISNLISTDDLIIGTLKSDELALINVPAVKAQIDEIYSRYYKAFSEIGVSFQIICIGENGFTYASQPNYTSEDFSMIKSYSWFNKNIGAKNGTYLITNLSNYSTDHKKATDIAIVHNVFTVTGDYKGTFLVCIPEKILEDTYSDLVRQNNFYILNPLSVVVSSSDKSILGSIPLDFFNYRFAHSTKDYSIIQSNGKPYFSAKYVSPKTDWVVFEQIPLDTVLSPMKPIAINTVKLVCIASFISVAVAVLVSKRITKPLMEFCSKMNLAIVNQFKPIESDSNLIEIKTLNIGFNHMIAEISSLMEHIKQKEKDTNDAKFNFLRAQINPHFLYNTLFSIKCTVAELHTEQACEMISILISVLRNSISTNQSTSTLLSETAYIKQYVNLQNLRYNNTIILKFSLPQTLMEKTMLRFILQPLVENAIMHSSITSSTDAYLQEIFIAFFQIDDMLKIEVCNNGSTFTEEELKIILSKNSVPHVNRSPHIGLQNIENRIHLLYGECYGLYIGKSNKYCTVVGISLPLDAEGDHENVSNTSN